MVDVQSVSNKTKKILTRLEPPARAGLGILGAPEVHRSSTEDDEEEKEERQMAAEEHERAEKERRAKKRVKSKDRPFDYCIKLLLLGDSGACESG